MLEIENAEILFSPIGFWLSGFGFSISELFTTLGSNSTFDFSTTVSVSITRIVSTFGVGLCLAGSFLFESTME
jgi:hypothetical protein